MPVYGPPISGQTTTALALKVDRSNSPLNATDPTFGAVGDGQTIETGAMTSGSATLTCTGAAFATTDIGKPIGVAGAGAAGARLITTIAARTSATVVTLTVAASTTVTAAHVGWGTDNANAFDAIFAAADVNHGMGKVFTPGGMFMVSRTLTQPVGVEWEGVGGAFPTGRPGTTIDGSLMASGAIVTTSEFWHHGSIRRMRLANGPSHAIRVTAGLGETATFDLLAIYYNGGDGIVIEGPSTPLHLGRLSIHANGGAGLRLTSQAYTACQIVYLGGDNNIESLMTVDGGSTSSTVDLLDWKAERSTNGARPVGHDVVFLLRNLNGGFVNLGYGQAVQTTGGGGGTAIVQQVITGGGTVGRVRYRYGYNNGSGGADYTYGYQDVPNSITRTIAQTIRKSITVREGMTFLDGTGSSTATLLVETSSGPSIWSSPLTPLATLSANPGSLCLRENGSLYQKGSATDSTGWLLIPRLSAATRPRTARWLYPMGGGSANTTATLNQPRYVPVWVMESVTATELNVQITSAGTAGALQRLAIYADDGNGFPTGSPIAGSEGTVAADTTGNKTLSISIALSPACYWLASCSQVATSQVQGINGFVVGIVGFAAGQTNLGGYVDGSSSITGALSTPNIQGNTTGPAVNIKIT